MTPQYTQWTILTLLYVALWKILLVCLIDIVGVVEVYHKGTSMSALGRASL